MNLEDFYTIDKENEGSRMILRDPTGKETDEWIIVYGAYSDEFKKADHLINKEILKLLESNTLTDEDKRLTTDRLQAKAIASLIKSWSFEAECNDANKIELMIKAPRLAEDINVFAKKGSLFFKKEENNSAKG